MRARAKGHQTQLPILPLQNRRMLKAWHPAHLPQVVTANKVTDEAVEIKGVGGMAESGERVEAVVTNAVDVTRRTWAVANGGISTILSQLTTQLTKKSKSSRQTEAQRSRASYQAPED
jgi:hypothetical protein